MRSINVALFVLLLTMIFNVKKVYAKDMKAFAWQVDRNRVEFILSNKTPVELSDISLKDSSGKLVEIKSFSQQERKVLIETKHELSSEKNIQLIFKSQSYWLYPEINFLNKNFYYHGEDLGVDYRSGNLHFKLWSPTAESVTLVVYVDKKTLELPLKKMKYGVWYTKSQQQELLGKPYQYKVKAFGEEKLVLDPYAKSMTAFNPKTEKVGKGVILNLRAKENYKPIKNMANAVDFIGYEAHIRDFTMNDESLPKEIRGTYKGFEGRLEHIQKLGITHIQFMPLQNFYTVNESDRSFQGEGASSKNINYNWGYDPQNYFTPEGWFSSEANNANARVLELKSLFEQVHQRGMGVILDVVYNHLYSQNTLLDVAPGCYLRRNELGYISYRSGAGASLESRNLMVRKLIIDSLKHWRDFYHVDGFRFDLMGFHDHETMKEIRKELGDDVILYGEAWEFTDLPTDQATTKSNMPTAAKLGAFNDTSRDSYTGHMKDKGFVQGKFSDNLRVRAGLIGGIKDYPKSLYVSDDAYHRFASSPIETLNYLSIHDGYTLWDKINLSLDASEAERVRRMKMALGMLFTSQGRVIIHGGTELGRSKPLATNDPNPDRAHTSELVNTENGVRFFHENTYNSPDSTNAISWSQTAEKNKIQNYLQGLIKLRRAAPALRFSESKSIVKGMTFFADQKEEKIINEKLETMGYQDFKDPKLTSLNIEFINAHQSAFGRTYFLVGEVIPGQDKNPAGNPFAVKFNEQGRGVLSLNRSQLDELDLKAWSDPKNLQVKLVKAKGSWDSLTDAYTAMGNNTIKPGAIIKGNRVIVDLSIINHTTGERPRNFSSMIAYRLNNTLESDVHSDFKPLKYKEFIVIHNAGDKKQELKVKGLIDPQQWDVLVDSQQAGINPLKSSEVEILEGAIWVERNSTYVLGHKQ